MPTFREFLQEREQQVRAEDERERERIDRWSRYVSELADRVTGWLQEADSRNLLRIEGRIVDVDGGLAGTHPLTSLMIRLGSRNVEFVPLAGPVMGPMIRPRRTNWLGRVDLIGSCTYNLYCRADEDDEAEWVAVNDSNYQVSPLTREFFDEVMRELFS